MPAHVVVRRLSPAGRRRGRGTRRLGVVLQPGAYIFALPDNFTDAIVHLVTAAVMFGVAAVRIRRDGGLYDSLGELSLKS